jgi:hypothetical protein
LLLAVIDKGTVSVRELCRVSEFSYHDVLVMLTRAKLGGILFEDDSVNAGLFISEDKAEATIVGILSAGVMAGTFVHNANDEWTVGDQSDFDGTNWKQHFACGLASCSGKRYVFDRGAEAPQ